MSADPPDYNIGTRWICPERKVWEKREWGWKFIGIACSLHTVDVASLKTTECDHPLDIFHEQFV